MHSSKIGYVFNAISFCLWGITHVPHKKIQWNIEFMRDFCAHYIGTWHDIQHKWDEFLTIFVHFNWKDHERKFLTEECIVSVYIILIKIPSQMWWSIKLLCLIICIWQQYPFFLERNVVPEQGAADPSQNLPTIVEICKAVSARTGSAEDVDGWNEELSASANTHEAGLAGCKSENLEGLLMHIIFLVVNIILSFAEGNETTQLK